MSIKPELKARICLPRMIPNYPLGPLLQWLQPHWASGPALLKLLEEIQAELDQARDEYQARTDCEPEESVQLGYWCLYCEQIRAYCRTVLKHPERERWLRFLL